MRRRLLLALTASGASADAGGRCPVDPGDLWECQGLEETPVADATTMLQAANLKARHVKITEPGTCSLAADAVWAAMDSYKKQHHSPPLPWVADAAGNLQSAFWKPARLWPAESDHTNIVDYARLWVKDGSCLMAFRGSFKKCSYTAGTPTFIIPRSKGSSDFHGLHVHPAVKAELEAALEKMQPAGGLGMLKEMCAGGLTLAGHSLGGGTAQLLATLLNKKGDPLGAGLTVDYLYGFGPTPFVKSATAANDRSADGCFAGGMYVNALGKDARGVPQVDLVWQLLTPAKQGQYRHVKAAHHILLSSTEEIVTPCGQEVPYPYTNRTVRASGWEVHGEGLYIDNVGC